MDDSLAPLDRQQTIISFSKDHQHFSLFKKPDKNSVILYLFARTAN